MDYIIKASQIWHASAMSLLFLPALSHSSANLWTFLNSCALVVICLCILTPSVHCSISGAYEAVSHSYSQCLKTVPVVDR